MTGTPGISLYFAAGRNRLWKCLIPFRSSGPCKWIMVCRCLSHKLAAVNMCEPSCESGPRCTVYCTYRRPCACFSVRAADLRSSLPPPHLYLNAPSHSHLIRLWHGLGNSLHDAAPIPPLTVLTVSPSSPSALLAVSRHDMQIPRATVG